MTASAIMVLGTSSHAGKSLLTAALCRIFTEQGWCVAPFKAQNMSLNSAVTVEGLEIGRAQSLQAEAAGIPPSVHMNPILLKPAGDGTSQIIAHGRIWGKLSAADYHQRRVEELVPLVRMSYELLAARNDVLVLEGAGSPAEINLKQHDIVNMRMAEMADASCLLVGDIDRGGVFASLLGTVELLEPTERARIRGFVVNKFRGDLALLAPGLRMMEDRIGKPCLGVVPYLEELALDEEDSVGMPLTASWNDAAWTASDTDRPLRIAVIALPSISNFTDFDALRSEPAVSVLFTRSFAQLTHADVVVISGSKQTVDDLEWMRSQELDRAIIKCAETGLIVGICGGMQMLGHRIEDPLGIESARSVDGLSLLPLVTSMNAAKTTRSVRGHLAINRIFGQNVRAANITGYEIHVGRTAFLDRAQIFAQINCLRDGESETVLDGCATADGRVFGTYIHGLFDDDGFRKTFIDAARAFHGLAPASEFSNWKKKREESFTRLARTVRESLDMEAIFGWAGLCYREEVVQ